MLTELIEWGLNPEFITPEFLASQGFSVTLPWRFIRKVSKTDSCWLWTALRDRDGYGRIKRGGEGTTNACASRISWILHNGPILDGQQVLHNCPGGDNPACVNPTHLWIGTNVENHQDKAEKHRSPFGEKHGLHKLTWSKVAKIRALYADGFATQVELARRYGVWPNAIWMVVHHKSWNHWAST